MAVTLVSYTKKKLNSGCLRKVFCRKYLDLKLRTCKETGKMHVSMIGIF